MTQWKRLLRPGGAAIVVNRVRPGSRTGPVAVSVTQVSAIEPAVAQPPVAVCAALGCDPSELARDAAAYMSRRVAHSLQRDELIGLFEKAGFTIRDIDGSPVTAAVHQGVTGLT